MFILTMFAKCHNPFCLEFYLEVKFKTNIVVLAFLIIYWESMPLLRKRKDESYKQFLYRSVNKITNQRINR